MKKLLFLAVSAFCAMSANATLSTSDYSSNNYLQEWGKLTLNGNQLSSSTGEAVQLKGWSTFSINYGEVVSCLGKDAFEQMKAWGANIVRLAVYPSNSKGGYVTYPENTVNDVLTYVEYCHDLGMYCLIDWHVLQTDDGGYGDPAHFKTQAQEFFTRISKEVVANKWNDCVIYEACNEPSGVSWSDIKSYATNYVLPALKANDPGCICLVGTPEWDQHPENAAADPISFDGVNIMYTFHYYACSHKYLIGNFTGACAKVPMFVSEWGSGRFDGGGTTCCTSESDYLMSMCQKENNGYQTVSWCYWAWGEKSEYSNCLSSCGSYSSDKLTTSGKYIVGVLGGKDLPTVAKAGAYKGTAQKIPTRATAEYGELNVGYFDQVRDEAKVTLPSTNYTKNKNTILDSLWGQGEGIAYHDCNSSAYAKDEDGLTDYTVAAGYGTGDEAYGSCNAGAKYNWMNDQTGEITENFRSFECVDVSNGCAGPNADWSGSGKAVTDLHNICMTEAGEWLKYTINVTKKGYYKLSCLTSTTTYANAPVAFSINGENILRSSEDLTNKKAVSSFYVVPMASCEYKALKQEWRCWEWNTVIDPVSEEETIRVLFKNEGEQTLLISINPDGTDTPGDFSDFLFEYDTENTTIPADEYISDGVQDVQPIEFAIYPNPAENDFNIVLADATEAAIANVMNAQGQIVASASFVGKTQINANLAKGVYMVQVITKEGTKSQKLVVK